MREFKVGDKVTCKDWDQTNAPLTVIYTNVPCTYNIVAMSESGCLSQWQTNQLTLVPDIKKVKLYAFYAVRNNINGFLVHYDTLTPSRASFKTKLIRVPAEDKEIEVSNEELLARY